MFRKPLPLQDEDIEEILDEESEFIAALDMDMNQLASFGFSKLQTELMIHLKGVYEIEKDNEGFELPHEVCEVDYIADTFKWRPAMLLQSRYTITQSMAYYAFWLQHESLRTDKPLSRDFHKVGWFERRISWFLELMDVMEVTADMLEESMGSISVTETRTEKINRRKTVKSFLEAIQKARNKNQGRETG
ncbi:hypothetical protein CDV36_008822 [Fusarium kuroshium]|uniref:Uncharacterized protein n=1 Tax=Fusarium kuroshium TaxID=2010991 RepID=A0A3M2S1Z4_9HYPO|nr:hypothetical protein CDV36_008822 [Fusarium kuroshium]